MMHHLAQRPSVTSRSMNFPFFSCRARIAAKPPTQDLEAAPCKRVATLVKNRRIYKGRKDTPLYFVDMNFHDVKERGSAPS
jgi:hypothetical protein